MSTGPEVAITGTSVSRARDSRHDAVVLGDGTSRVLALLVHEWT